MSRMNEGNYEFITETVFPRFGIPQSLEQELMTQMKNGADTIVLSAAGQMDKSTTEFSFKFDYNAKDDRYYLNTVQASLTKENGEARSHEFRVFNQRGYDVEEMSKLLDGKFVYKEVQREGKDYNHWATISATQKDEDGNNIMRRLYDNTTKFNLATEVSKLPLAYMSQDDKEKLLREMRQGEAGTASIKKQDGSKERVNLYPRPDIGRIDVINKDGHRLRFGEEKLHAVGENKVTEKLIVKSGEENGTKGEEKKQGRKAS